MGDHGIPQSRTEAILQNMLGEDNVLDPPQSRVEALLTEILENGGSGSGAPGKPGKDGVTPDITMIASVDGTSGTPSVNISKNGTKENPIFNLEFSGLKGQPGTSYDDTELREDIADIWKAQGELGAKNLLKYIDGIFPYSKNGISYTLGQDGSIIIDGTATAYNDLVIFNVLNLGVGRFVLNTKETLPSNCYIQIIDYTVTSVLTYVGNGFRNSIEFTVTPELMTHDLKLRITITEGSFDNYALHTMIRHVEDTNDTWQPYVPTNKELVKELNNVANFVWEKEIDELPSYEGIARRYYPFKFEVGTKYEIQCGISAFTASTSGAVAFNLRTANGTSIVEDISGEINYNNIKTGIYSWTFIPKQAADTLYLYYNVAVEPLKITFVINAHVNMNNILPITGEYLPTTANGTVKKYSAAIGATTATFNASAFMSKYNATSSDLNLDISAETTSGNVLAYNSVAINSSGVITITFDELTEAATFVCKASKIQ